MSMPMGLCGTPEAKHFDENLTLADVGDDVAR